jgi:FtsZ-binding cell division protein ZapB
MAKKYHGQNGKVEVPMRRRRAQQQFEDMIMSQLEFTSNLLQMEAERQHRHYRVSRAWDHVNELQEECYELQEKCNALQKERDELAEEVEMLRERLSRSEALNMIVFVQREALFKTIKHLKKAWDPKDPNEAVLKEKIAPFINKEIEKIKADPVAMQELKQEIEQEITRTIKPRKPRP